jgi:hemerythrin superfamily protein
MRTVRSATILAANVLPNGSAHDQAWPGDPLPWVRHEQWCARLKRSIQVFDWLLLSEKHAIALLKKDHDTVKALFEAFEKADTQAAKRRIVEQALTELKIHAVLEEEIFYPTVRRHVGSKLMNEADEEHHVAKVLIAELDTVPDKNDHRDAKFTVLAESVRHHI